MIKKCDDLLKKTGQNKVPYVFINNTLIGGLKSYRSGLI
jgi:glutaredoxin